MNEKDIEKVLKRYGVIITPIIIAVILLFTSIYTIQEGYVGIVKRFGKAIEQVDAGIHLKIPFTDSIQEIEVRTKKNTEKMMVATSEQMRAEAIVSINWTVKREAVLDLYKKYGSLAQFEERILDPRLREVSKQGIAMFTAEENINKRESVTNAIKEAFLEEITPFPVVINSVQYENISLPTNYLESIDRKQTAKNERDAEQFKLEKQKLEAMREVNTADAQKQARKLEADGIAYKIETEAKAQAKKVELLGKAEATAIELKAKALKNNPLIVELTKAQNWNGILPTTVMGDSSSVLMDLRK